MKLGGFKPGAWPEIIEFARRRLPGFVLVLGDADEEVRAIAEAADCFEFPVIYEGQTARAVEDAQHLVQRGMLARGILPRVFGIDVHVPYGPAFEEEIIDYDDFQAHFGGGDRVAFQLLEVAAPENVTDGKIEVIGPDPSTGTQPAHLDLGLVVRVAGPRLIADYEMYLEKQIGSFINYASGVRHTGGQEAISIRIGREAAARGFTLESIGKILHRRFRQEFGEAIQKVQVALITDLKQHAPWYEKALAAYAARARRLASLTDNDVQEFYTCSRCRAFSPSDICLISPERISACGGCNWLEAKATYELHPGGLRRPIKLGKQLDARKGTWEGTNAYARSASQGRVEEVSLYSIMDHPLGACGAFECLVMLIPEANGVMVVAQDETSKTPAGLDVNALANITGGIPMPGVMGVGKRYLLSPRFMSADGGFRRVVWMSSTLKNSMGSELRAVCAREGQPDLLAKIADERHVTSVQQLMQWLKKHEHPALTMTRMY
jgi:CO dehydrogenase/acetyl-CoA synthase beta subunit